MNRGAAATARLPRPRSRLRWLWPDRNPLRRGCDRAEAAIMATLLATFLIAGPWVGLFAGHWTYSAGLRAERAGAARHRVAAVLLGNAIWATQSAGWPLGSLRVQARWVAPDGAPRTGAVLAPVGARAGRTVLVWTDASGRLTGPPARHEHVAGQAVFGAVLAVAGLGLGLWCCGMLSRRALDRRRQAAWEADWRMTGPRWTSRR